jgi:hypothetical protein
MNIADVIEILKIVGVSYFIIDSIALMYVWCWKEYHYQYRILMFPIPLTGIFWILSDYKKFFKEVSETRRGGLF